MMRVAITALLITITVAAQPSIVAAQPNTETAAAHIERGMTRYDAGDYEQALAEFRAAYDLAPDPAVLYNLARVHERLDHPVEAVSFYEHYLNDAGRISRRERREIDRSLSRLRDQIGSVRVEVNVQGAVIMIGGVDRATTPLVDPLRVEAGSVEVSARATGHDVARQVVSVAGGEEVLVRLTLRPLLERRGSIRVRSNLSGVEVRVDGEFVGTTPMTPTHLTSPGAHLVEGQRAGYQTTRETVEVQDAVDSEVTLRMQIDPNADPSVMGSLRLRTPVTPERLEIDGSSVDVSEQVELPIGPHDVRIFLPERRPSRGRVDIEAGEELELAPQFSWTDAALATRRESAASRRQLGWAFVGAGGVLVIAGLVPILVARGDLNSDANEARKDMLDFCELPENRGTLECSPDGPNMFDFDLEQERYNNLVERTNLQKALGYIGLGAGLALSATGLTLVLLAASDDEIEDAANEVSLHVGPTRASVRLVF